MAVWRILATVLITIIYAMYNILQVFIALVFMGVKPVEIIGIVVGVTLISLMILDKIIWYTVLKKLENKTLTVTSLISYVSAVLGVIYIAIV